MDITKKFLHSDLEKLRINRQLLDQNHLVTLKKTDDKTEEINLEKPENSENNDYSQVENKPITQIESKNIEKNCLNKNLLSIGKISKISENRNRQPQNKNKKSKKSNNLFGRKTQKVKNNFSLKEIEENESDVQFDSSDSDKKSKLKTISQRNLPVGNRHLEFLIEKNLVKLDNNNNDNLKASFGDKSILKNMQYLNVEMKIEIRKVKIIKIIVHDESNARYLVQIDGYNGINILFVSSSLLKNYSLKEGEFYNLKIKKCLIHNPNCSNPNRFHFTCLGIPS